ncbi:MAG: class I SAM-dependent methyltransferase [Mariniblastus sp.]
MRLLPKIRNRQALRINSVRQLIGRTRLRWAIARNKIKTLDSKHSVKETIQHNLKSLKDFSNCRIELLIRPLSVIESVREAKSVLLIGPRNENDLLIASTYLDLPLECVRGLDLISYSKQIDLGDMHQMPYEDNSFDVVICGWTVSYSEQPQQLANEMIRVCKPGGVMAVGLEYGTLDPEGYEKLLGYSLAIPGVERINSVKQINDLFQPQIDQVFFSHDAPLKRSHNADGLVAFPSSVASIFSIKESVENDTQESTIENQNCSIA